MTIMYVSYPGDADTRFDRDYYVSRHLPLVMESWGRYGLLSCAAFFPAGDGAGTVAICECRFRDEASLRTALASAESERVMADVTSFTKATPAQFQPAPISGMPVLGEIDSHVDWFSVPGHATLPTP